MTDNELLEKAAHIAGAKLNRSLDMFVIQQQDGVWIEWNPITDDGDALRLAVKLGIEIFPMQGFGGRITTVAMPQEFNIESIFERHNGDAMAATRRAIVRAAAALADKK